MNHYGECEICRSPKKKGAGRFCSMKCFGVFLQRQASSPQYFWSRVSIKTPDECWTWTGCKRGTRGYGCIKFKGTYQPTHRVAWELANDPIPAGLLVCHKCDNPPCCNPAHLFLGTTKDNADDMVRKGRNVVTLGAAKLTESQVNEIRSRYKPGTCESPQLAREYGVCVQTIMNIVNRKSWNKPYEKTQTATS